MRKILLMVENNKTTVINTTEIAIDIAFKFIMWKHEREEKKLGESCTSKKCEI